jgi:hypothetical protein
MQFLVSAAKLKIANNSVLCLQKSNNSIFHQIFPILATFNLLAPKNKGGGGRAVKWEKKLRGPKKRPQNFAGIAYGVYIDTFLVCLWAEMGLNMQ